MDTRIANLRNAARALKKIMSDRVPRLTTRTRQARLSSYIRGHSGLLNKASRQCFQLAEKWNREIKRVGRSGFNSKMDRAFNLRYRQLQKEMRRQNREFQTISNVIKAKHDATNNAINNIR